MNSKLFAIYRPMRYSLLYFALSLAIILPGIYSLTRWGLKLGIDFTGGSTFVWQSNLLTEESLRTALVAHKVELEELTIQADLWSITTSPLTRETYQNLLSDLSFAALQEQEFNTVGPSIGRELVQKTMVGLGLAASLILLYVAYRFKNVKYGACAILAMLHDSLVMLGVFSLLGHFLGVKVDTLFVTALLTILSFSVHDTIIVYDRIRELKKKHGYLDFEDIVNRAVVETLGRSINNSMTIIFMLLSMYLLGGDTTRWFIFALLIGTISGTYSSTFTAAPLLLVWDKFSRKK